MTLILDASALLASLLQESGGDLVESKLHSAVLSTVNLAEVVAALHKKGNSADEIEATLRDLSLATIAPDEQMATTAGLLRATTERAGLSLGDRFCCALALRLHAPVLTADRNWTLVADDIGVRIHLIR